MPYKLSDLTFLYFPAGNMGLEYLDIAWNHLRLKGAVAIAEALKASLRTNN